MKRARIREAALAVLLREGFDSETAKRLADLIAHEPVPIPAKAPEPDKPEGLERVLLRATEPH
jgi:hypothetical protein